MKEKFFIVAIVIIAAFALYVGGWILFLNPIINAILRLQEGTLSSSIILGTIVKCLIAPIVSSFIFKKSVKGLHWILFE